MGQGNKLYPNKVRDKMMSFKNKEMDEKKNCIFESACFLLVIYISLLN